MKFIFWLVLILISDRVFGVTVTYAGGVGARYGGIAAANMSPRGFPGFQVGVVMDKFKFNGGTAILGGSAGVEYNFLPRQSIDITAGFMAFNGLHVGAHYNLYLGKQMYRGICLSVGYENWQGERTSVQETVVNLGYHF